MINCLFLYYGISLLYYIKVSGYKNEMVIYHFYTYNLCYNKNYEINNISYKEGISSYSLHFFSRFTTKGNFLITLDHQHVKYRFKSMYKYEWLHTYAHSNLTPKIRLNPHWVSGFVDARGCFMISVREQAGSTGWGVSACFTLRSHINNLPLLLMIQSFFGGIGGIYVWEKSAIYTVGKLEYIINVIIPHFKQYPLQSSKKINFQLWSECVDILANKEHLSELGLKKIISIKSAINKGLTEHLKLKFKDVKPIIRPEFIVNDNPLNPYWVSGFSEGYKHISFDVFISSKIIQVTVFYNIILNIYDEPLILKIQEFFGGIGIISHYNNVVQYIVADINNINSTLIPHFDTYILYGNKLSNYLTWKEILLLVNSKAHLNPEGLSNIKSLKYNLNKW